MKPSILITGASGFIGSFLVEEALRKGFETWAGIRHSSSTRYLKHPGINLIELDFGKRENLEKQLKEFQQQHGKWEVVIHCAGVTKCSDKADFDRFNYEATRHLVEALQGLDMTPRQFVYLSSLSIYGPIHEGSDTPIGEADKPCPNTAYGRSKIKTEAYLKSLDGFPYVIFRPTGVYGPREKDYFLMAKSIRSHVDFAAGFKRQDLTFIYVKDLVQAIYLAIGHGVTQRAYFVSDGAVYDSRTFSDLIQKELGNPWVIHFRCPLFLLKIISLLAQWGASLVGKSSTLNSDKYNIMKQRNWRCDITPLYRELGYKPEYPLERGVKETIAWYKEEKWL